MSTENEDFYNLLNDIVNEQAFDLELINGQTVKCKQLTTAQLKELVKTFGDSELTQVLFHSAATKIFEESVIDLPSDYQPTVLDRLLFLLETRIQSVSPTLTMTDDEGNEVITDIVKVKTNILDSIKQNRQAFERQTFTNNKISLVTETPKLATENKLNSEIYNGLDVDTSDVEQLKNFIADSFINEIAKYVSSVTLNEEITLNFSEKPFQERLDVLQKLPAGLIQSVITYIEKQKELIDELFINNDMYLSVDSTFFTTR